MNFKKKEEMKKLSILILIASVIISCKKLDIEKGTPKCIENKIKDFNKSSNCNNAKDNDPVVVKLLQWDNDSKRPVGEVVTILEFQEIQKLMGRNFQLQHLLKRHGRNKTIP